MFILQIMEIVGGGIRVDSYEPALTPAACFRLRRPNGEWMLDDYRCSATIGVKGAVCQC